MSVDINDLDQNQLNDLIGQAQSRQDELRKEKLIQLRETTLALIKQEGFTFDEVFGKAATKRQSANPVPPKYRNPADPTQTWSGRGMRPRWFEDALQAGKEKEDMAI